MMLPALCLAPLLALVAACETLPDNPEISDASVSVTLATPTGVARIIVACPPMPGAIPTPKHEESPAWRRSQSAPASSTPRSRQR